MIDYRRAISLVRSALYPVDSERIGLSEAVGRVTSEDIETPGPLPPAPVARVGGWAVHWKTSLHEEAPPVTRLPILPGEPLREDLDTVLEDRVDSPDGSQSPPYELIVRGENVIAAGEIMKPGDIAIQRGRVLSPAEIGLLADLGMRRIGVYARPRVAVLTIGDDLLRVDEIRIEHMRYDWAGALISSCIEQCGGEYVLLGPVSENPEDIEFGVSKGLEEDALIISARVGQDRGAALTQILKKQGIDFVFDGVSLWPGGDVLLGHIKDRPVLVLPLAVGELLVSTELLLVPFIFRISGRDRSIRRGINAILETPIRNPRKDVESFAWGVSVTGDREPYRARPVPQWPGAACYHSPSIYGLCISEMGEDLPSDRAVEVLPLLTRLL